MIKVKDYLVHQLTVDRSEFNGMNHDTYMSIIIRKVIASSEEEAIGKFVVQTQDIKVEKRLDIVCFELSKLTTIK